MGWFSSHFKPSEVAAGRPVREVVGWTLWLVSNLPKDPKGLVAAEEEAGGGNCTLDSHGSVLRPIRTGS